MKFGTQEDIECISPIALRGPGGEPLCLAHKVSTTFVGLGVSVSDDGYVLEVTSRRGSYIPLDDARIAALQAQGSLPTPLPGYELSPLTYVLGYSLWITLVVIAAFTAITWRRNARRRIRDAAAAISGPPVLRTAGDRFIAEQFAQVRRDGEVVERQAYVLAQAPRGGLGGVLSQRAYFAVLTDQRLLRFETRVGAFSILFENRGVLATERRDISRADLDGDTLTLVLRGGGAITMFLPGVNPKKLSNQEAFRLDVARLLTGAVAAEPAPAPGLAPA